MIDTKKCAVDILSFMSRLITLPPPEQLPAGAATTCGDQFRGPLRKESCYLKELRLAVGIYYGGGEREGTSPS